MKKQHHAIKAVKQQAAGKWHDILSHLCPALADALARPGKHVDCAIHGGKKDFRLFRDYAQTGGGACTCGTYKDGFDLLCAMNHCTLDEAVSAVADLLGMANNIPKVTLRTLPKPRIDPKAQASTDRKRRYWLERIWEQASGDEHFRSRIALHYLQQRGLKITSLPKALRLHPSLQYFDDEAGQRAGAHPAMVAQVRDPAGRPVTLRLARSNSPWMRSKARQPRMKP